MIAKDSLVAGGVDGNHVFEAEVPLQVGVQEGHHKGAGSSIHMNLDVPLVLLIHLACKPRTA